MGLVRDARFRTFVKECIVPFLPRMAFTRGHGLKGVIQTA